MAHADEFNRVDSLSRLTLSWRALLGQTRGGSFLQSLPWVTAYCEKAFGRVRPRILAVESDGSPVGLLPLVVRRESSRLGPVRVLTYPWPDWVSTRGPIGPSPTATLAVAMRHIQATPRDWELIDLRGVDLRGGDFGRTQAAMDRVGLRPSCRSWHGVGVIDLGGPAPRPLQRATPQLDATSASPRCATTDRSFEFARYRPGGRAHDDENPAWDVFDQGAAMRALVGAQSRGRTIAEELDQARRMHDDAVRAGGAEMAVLRRQGRAVAWWYGYCASGRVDGVALAWDGPVDWPILGQRLLERVIADSRERGDRHFVFGPGWPAWVARHCTTVRTTARYTHFSPHARAQLLRLGRWLRAG